MPIYRPYKLPLCRAYVWGHYLVILDSVEFVYAIYHVSEAVHEVEQYPQSIVERHSLFEVDVVGVVSSPYTWFYCWVYISENVSISYTEISKALVHDLIWHFSCYIGIELPKNLNTIFLVVAWKSQCCIDVAIEQIICNISICQGRTIVKEAFKNWFFNFYTTNCSHIFLLFLLNYF